jgi:uncharacterized protein (TIGR00730 family)
MRKSNIIKAYLLLSVHLLRVFFNLLYGIWKLSKLKRAPITVFGGTKLKKESIYIEKARILAQRLLEHNIPVITGGGPGIMEAANCGAYVEGEKSVITTMGIGVKGLDEPNQFNPCVQEHIIMDYFFARKWLLVTYSIGFAVFPGGFGTLDELTELLTLIQTKMRKPAPIVLIGVEYWSPLMEWINESALRHGLITKEDVALFTITDDLEQALDLLCACAEQEISLF